MRAPDPCEVTTRTSCAPATPAGLSAVKEVSLVTVRPVTLCPPIVTDCTSVKPEPVMVIGVPPASGPTIGAMAVTSGGAAT